MARIVRIFRYDPADAGDGHFDSYSLEIPNETTTTILDVLLRLQEERDPTLAFRFACRVNMCGSCGMVINGTEALACKTNVSDIKPGREITIRPLNHFPVIKDLVVDMAPFFEKYDAVLPFYEPKGEDAEPAQIRPDSQERLDIAGNTECIACGCCVSSCTQADGRSGYTGPAALNRAFTLLADSRDGLFDQRLDRALESCYDCRSEFNCTEVCPKGISPARAIKYIQRLALAHPKAGRTLPAPTAAVTQHATTRRAAILGAAVLAAFGLFASFAYRFGPWGILTMMLASIALLFALPFLVNARQRPIMTAAAVTAAIGILCFALAGFADSRPYGQVIQVPDRPLTSSEAHGLKLFANLQCAGCHQIQGEGGHRVGPDLANIVAKSRSSDYLTRYIRNPETTAMPAYDLPESDLQSLADFVLSLDFSKYPAKILTRNQVR